MWLLASLGLDNSIIHCFIEKGCDHKSVISHTKMNLKVAQTLHLWQQAVIAGHAADDAFWMLIHHSAYFILRCDALHYKIVHLHNSSLTWRRSPVPVSFRGAYIAMLKLPFSNRLCTTRSTLLLAMCGAMESSCTRYGAWDTSLLRILQTTRWGEHGEL